MDNVTTLVFTICLAILVIWIIEGVRLYRSYKGDIYGTLFGGFLPYFFHYTVRRDCSTSYALRTHVGTSRMIFSAMQDKGATTARFCTIFYNRGIFTVCYQVINGEIMGKAKDKEWVVRRKDKQGETHSYRHLNPTSALEAYLRRLAIAYPDTHLEARIAVDDASDFSNLKSDVKVIHYADLFSEMNQVTAESISDEEVVQLFKDLGKKNHE